MSKSTTRKNRQTGTMITVISEAEAGLDADLKWWTVCEDHDRLVGHYTKANALANASDPMSWCGVCNGTEPAELEEEAAWERQAAEQHDSIDMTPEELAEQREIMMADLEPAEHTDLLEAELSEADRAAYLADGVMQARSPQAINQGITYTAMTVDQLKATQSIWAEWMAEETAGLHADSWVLTGWKCGPMGANYLLTIVGLDAAERYLTELAA